MLRSNLLALSAIVVGGIAWSAGLEEPAYTLQLRKPEKGDVAIVLDKHDFTSRAKVTGNQPPKGEVKEERPLDPFSKPAPPQPAPAGDAKPPRTSFARGGWVFLFEETILETDAKQHPTRLERRYEQALSKKDGKKTTLSFEWQTVRIEKKDDKFHYTVDGSKELAGEDARTLDEEFAKGPSPWDDGALLLPKKPVRVNDSWAIAVEPFVKDMEENKQKVDADKSTAKGKLLRVYDKDGKRFGVIEARMEFPLKNPGEDGAVPMVIDITLDACIDGSSVGMLRTEKVRIGEVGAGQGDERLKQPGSFESSWQLLRKEVRKK